MIVLFVACAVIGAGLPLFFIRGLGFGVVQAEAPVVAAAVAPAASDVRRVPVERGEPVPVAPLAPRTLDLPWTVDDKPEKPLWVSGVVRRGTRIAVWLTDGRVLTHLDPELRRVDNFGAVVDGRRIYMKPWDATRAGTRDERPQLSGVRWDGPTGRPALAGDDLPDSLQSATSAAGAP